MIRSVQVLYFVKNVTPLQNVKKIGVSPGMEQCFFSHGSSNSTGCAIAFSKSLNIDIHEDKISKDDNGRIIIVEATLDSKKFLLINFYNANTEKEQLVVLDTLCKLLDNHDTDDSFHPIYSGF